MDPTGDASLPSCGIVPSPDKYFDRFLAMIMEIVGSLIEIQRD
jgi:hypothetical protein